MKKLLSVLLVLTLVSFLWVGCLPVTPSEGEGEGEGVAEVIIEIEKEYKNPAGVTYVPCKDKVTVTFPTPVDTDYIVYIARKIVDGEGNIEYRLAEPEPVAAIPNADRTVWTVEGYEFLYEYPCVGLNKDVQNRQHYCSCEPICLVALVKHPCCPGEEVALRVVTVDCQSPILDLFVKFTDCADSCEEPDPCNPSAPDVYMEWTSNSIDNCESISCCADDCSGVASWSIEVNPDSCEGPCTRVTGEGCPVEGVIDCGCLTYADAGTIVVHTIVFTMADNVGNTDTSTWELTFTPDRLSTFEFVNYGVIPEREGYYQVYGECTNRD